MPEIKELLLFTEEGIHITTELGAHNVLQQEANKKTADADAKRLEVVSDLAKKILKRVPLKLIRDVLCHRSSTQERELLYQLIEGALQFNSGVVTKHSVTKKLYELKDVVPEGNIVSFANTFNQLLEHQTKFSLLCVPRIDEVIFELELK